MADRELIAAILPYGPIGWVRGRLGEARPIGREKGARLGDAHSSVWYVSALAGIIVHGKPRRCR
jgi:hypothetical protein